jgi:hypothetical protein
MSPQPQPTEAVRRALAYLDVGLVCVANDRREFVPVIERLGPYKQAFFAGGEVCSEHLPAGS